MYQYEEIKEVDIEELTEIMTRAFDDDTRMHTSLETDGPSGYNDGSLIRWLMKNYISQKILFDGKLIGMYSVSDDFENRELEMFVIDPKEKNHGHGFMVWKDISVTYKTKVWHVETPDYSRRNYHFYVDKCGFTCVGKKQYDEENASYLFTLSEKITLCGDNCLKCPRYLAQTDDELHKVAELWQRAGWRDHVVSNEEIRCTGCSSHKQCTYHLVECIKEHGVDKCNQCTEFSCDKISDMLDKSEQSKNRCKQVCTPEEYQMLADSFFNKEENLKK